jgi:polysaccharide pyruvyl transferase WcaK-like protein
MVQHARSHGKPVVFVGVGTESLRRPESRALVTEFMADYVAHWSVRSIRDRERLLALGVAPDRVTAAADMAWLLPPAHTDFGHQTLGLHGLAGRRLVGVNVNAERALLELEPKLFEKLAAMLDELVAAHGVHVLFLCNEVREEETFDKAAAARVRSHMRRKDAAFTFPNEYLAPQQMMSVIAACALTISTRYHFCLFSALQGVPFLAIKRSDKVADLCEDLGWPFGGEPGSIDMKDLSRQAAALLTRPAPELQGLSDRVRVMKERASRNHAALDALRLRAGSAPGLTSLRAALGRR